MRTLILSTGFAAAMGVLALTPASAAPIAARGVVAAPAITTDVACRTVKKVVVSRGVKRVTTRQECSPSVRTRVYVAPRRVIRPARPGITVRVR